MHEEYKFSSSRMRYIGGFQPEKKVHYLRKEMNSAAPIQCHKSFPFPFQNVKFIYLGQLKGHKANTEVPYVLLSEKVASGKRGWVLYKILKHTPHKVI